MRAVTFAEYGDPSVLQVTEVPEPHAGPGQVRVAVRAAGVNPWDWKVRAGYMKDVVPTALPAIPSLEAAGVVDEVGDGVEGVAVGDEVFGFAAAAAAEFAVMEHFAPKPAGLSWEEAGGLAVMAETAVRALEIIAPAPGQTLLIEGAAGGVGSAAAQFAIADGVTVIGTAGESNHAYLRSLGVLPTTYGPGLAERVAALAPKGVDVALDTAERARWRSSSRSSAPPTVWSPSPTSPLPSWEFTSPAGRRPFTRCPRSPGSSRTASSASASTRASPSPRRPRRTPAARAATRPARSS